jgi:pectate lyase
MATMQVIHEVDLDNEFFEDIICTMFEGGSNYWIDHIEFQSGKDKPKGTPVSTWIADVLNKGGTITIFIRESDEKIVLVKNMLIEGLDKWAMNYQDHVSVITENGRCTIDAGNIDADDADIILQFALFDDVVFG